MSRRRTVLDNEKQLLKELKEDMLDGIDIELDDTTPTEIIQAIRDLHDNEIISERGSSDVVTGQPYRLSDSDDFPFGTYIQNQTG